MKIAFLAAANSPHTIKWANVLADGNEVSVLSLPEDKDSFNELNEKITVTYLDASAAQGGLKKNAGQVKTILASGNFGAVNAIGATTYGVLAAKAKAPHTVLTVLGPDIYASVDLGKKGLVAKSFKHAEAIIAAAPNMVTRLKQLFKKEKNYFVAPFGVDLGAFQKKAVGKKEGTICFGSLKALEYGNGVDMVIEAFAKFLQKAAGEATLKIVGTGTMESSLKQQAQSAGIADKIEFVGYVPNAQMPDMINSMDVTIQMSATEAFGVTGIESMACCVPVIASDTVGASEYILNGVTGYLVKVNNTDRCCECMLELRDKAAREHMGQLARNDMEESFDLAKNKVKYEEALRSVAARVQ
ncbi:MAG: glycosyltransferase family 4 protein [Christensenella sp.]|uniref:glycosyltransferase family 4 protein n=1 Tax=Christensenella sp. TaxID=1935934 RepID=UPI002B1F73ED|nr:glycosyltransferase family 4 protein [Christensenella sp.]MEA5003610.1 glycosyltransferase family 4 protein [Christensenella sp.]